MSRQIHLNVLASQVSWCHSAGIGNHSTPSYLTLLHWKWRGEIIATPLSDWSTRRSSYVEIAASASPSAVSAASDYCRRISSLPSLINRAWSPDLNSAIPQSAVTRCPVMTQDAIQLDSLIWVVSGWAIPSYLTDIPVTSLPGIWDVVPMFF